MKKIFSFLAAGLLLASCSNDDFANKGVNGSEEEVIISVSLPEIESRAIAGGECSNLGGVVNNADPVTFSLEIYYKGQTTPVFRGEVDATTNPRTATFKPTLVIGEEYDFVAYAQFDGAANLTAQEEAFGINDEKQDAYYWSTTLKAEPVMSGVLKRPNGKLRLIALDYGLMKSQLGKDIKSVEVTYETARYNTFNSRTGEWTGATAETVYNAEKIEYTTEDYDSQATDNGSNLSGAESVAKATTVFVDYIPVNANKDEIVSIALDVTLSDDTHFTREINLDIPIRRNWLTTLVGNFFTSEMELTLVVEPAFENDKDLTYNYNELANAFALGGEYKLYNNMTIDEAVVLNGKDLVLDLNGYSINAVNGADAIVVNDGTLTIKGDGYITVEDATPAYAVFVDGANAVANIEGGTYTIGVDDITKVALTNASNSAVYTKNGGKATISGGKFQVKTSQEIDDVNATRFLINENDANRGTISINGGTFVKFNPANNLAEGANTNFVVDGYEAVEEEAGVWTVMLENATVVKNAEELVAAIANGGNIYLNDGTYAGLFTIPANKAVKIYAKGSNAVIDGKIAVREGANVTLNGLTLTDANPQTVTTNQFLAKTKASIIGAYDGSVNVSNCTFNVTQANNRAMWMQEGNNGVAVVENCVFNANGQRPITWKAKITVDNCVFNDPYKYAIQLFGYEAGSPATSVVFTNNTIVDGDSSAKELQAISISRSYKFDNINIHIENNEVNGAVYVYDTGDYLLNWTVTGDVAKSDFVARD